MYRSQVNLKLLADVCCETGLGVDVHLDDVSQEDHQTESGSFEDSACDKDLAWEDHPFYDDPHYEALPDDVPDDHQTVSSSDGDSPCEADLAWEDHPFYEDPDDDSEASEGEGNPTSEEDNDELAWEESPYY